MNIIKIIGKGAFSKVARATVWNLRDEQEYIEVAVKMLRSEMSISFRVITFLCINSLGFQLSSTVEKSIEITDEL